MLPSMNVRHYLFIKKSFFYRNHPVFLLYCYIVACEENVAASLLVFREERYLWRSDWRSVLGDWHPDFRITPPALPHPQKQQQQTNKKPQKQWFVLLLLLVCVVFFGLVRLISFAFGFAPATVDSITRTHTSFLWATLDFCHRRKTRHWVHLPETTA